MADRTQATETVRRSEIAAYLRGLADEFERESEEIAVEVGNKSVILHPPEEVQFDIEVVERSSVLRGNRETIDVELNWKP